LCFVLFAFCSLRTKVPSSGFTITVGVQGDSSPCSPEIFCGLPISRLAVTTVLPEDCRRPRLQKQRSCLLLEACCARYRHGDVSNPRKGLRPLWQNGFATEMIVETASCRLIKKYVKMADPLFHVRMADPLFHVRMTYPLYHVRMAWLLSWLKDMNNLNIKGVTI
jgi:hypothetical protein